MNSTVCKINLKIIILSLNWIDIMNALRTACVENHRCIRMFRKIHLISYLRGQFLTGIHFLPRPRAKPRWHTQPLPIDSLHSDTRPLFCRATLSHESSHGRGRNTSQTSFSAKLQLHFAANRKNWKYHSYDKVMGKIVCVKTYVWWSDVVYGLLSGTRYLVHIQNHRYRAFWDSLPIQVCKCI